MSSSAHGIAVMRGTKLLASTIVVALAGFMVILDTTICNVSVPTIAGALAVSPTQGTWVVTSYSVAEAVIVPMTGWLVLRFGMVRLFIASMLGFVTFSLACGFANSLEMMVSFRILQGIAGAPLLALSQTLLFTIYPPNKLVVGQGVFAMTAILAPIVGPIVGGYISDEYTWPWIFFINVPVGLLVAAAVRHLFQGRETIAQKTPIDRVGMALLVVAVGSLQLMLDKGKELDWFDSKAIVTLACIAVMGFAYLTAWELRQDNPIVNLRLFAIRNFTVGSVSLALIFGIFFGSVVLIPQWLQTYQHYPALKAGLALAPNGVLAVLLAPLVAFLSKKIDLRCLVTFSIMVFLCSFTMRALWSPQTDFFHIALPQLVQGLAMACFYLPLTQMAIGAVPASQIAMASGIQNFMRTAMGAFAASLAATYWDDQTQLHHAQLAQHFTDYSSNTQSTLHVLQGLGFSKEQALSLLNNGLSSQAALMAINDYFAWGILAFVFILGFVWMARPMKGGEIHLGH